MFACLFSFSPYVWVTLRDSIFLFWPCLTNWSKIQNFPHFWKTAQIWFNFFEKFYTPYIPSLLNLIKDRLEKLFFAKSFFYLDYLKSSKVFKMVQISWICLFVREEKIWFCFWLKNVTFLLFYLYIISKMLQTCKFLQEQTTQILSQFSRFSKS